MAVWSVLNCLPCVKCGPYANADAVNWNSIEFDAGRWLLRAVSHPWAPNTHTTLTFTFPQWTHTIRWSCSSVCARVCVCVCVCDRCSRAGAQGTLTFVRRLARGCFWAHLQTHELMNNDKHTHTHARTHARSGRMCVCWLITGVWWSSPSSRRLDRSVTRLF